MGTVAGSLTVGGPSGRMGTSRIAVAQVVDGVAGAASRLRSYHATFALTEHGLDGSIGDREFAMNVWFEAPERLRLVIADLTAYPRDSNLVPNRVNLVVNGSRSFLSGPSGCPAGLARSCPPVRISVRGRAPFSSQAPMPTDVVLPVRTLAEARGIEIVGRETIDGRPAVGVATTFDRATPLFPFLDLPGTWRPIFPKDRVVLWLDERDWSPLRYSVYPTPGAERRQWALRFGLPDDRPAHPVLEITTLSLEQRRAPRGTFTIPHGGTVRTEGAVRASLSGLLGRANSPLPRRPGGLRPYRAVLTPTARSSSPSAIVTYTSGLTWLKVGEQRLWRGDEPFGPIGSQAEEVRVANGGVAYYEPAPPQGGRRLAIHTDRTDLYVETNLARSDLLAVAASLPRGLPLPQAWRVERAGGGEIRRLSPERALALLPGSVLVPARLPPGSVLASAELLRIGSGAGTTSSVNLYYRPVESELGAERIRLHVEPADSLPAASSKRQERLEVRGWDGRWTPSRHLLEWIEDGVYYSLDGGESLADLLAIARTMRPAVPEQETP